MSENPKLSKARVSGVTYDLEDASAQSLISENEFAIKCLGSILNTSIVHFDPTVDDFSDLFPLRYAYIKADGTRQKASVTTVDVRLSHIFVAVPNEKISITLSESANRLVFAVYDKDGNLTHSVPTVDASTQVHDEYTFQPGDAYFCLSGRYAQRNSFSVVYTPGVRSVMPS